MVGRQSKIGNFGDGNKLKWLYICKRCLNRGYLIDWGVKVMSFIAKIKQIIHNSRVTLSLWETSITLRPKGCFLVFEG